MTKDACKKIQTAYPVIDRGYTDYQLGLIREISVENDTFDPFKFCTRPGQQFDGTESKDIPQLACEYINSIGRNTDTTWTLLHNTYGIASMWMECTHGDGTGCNHLNWITEEGELNGIVRVVCANYIIVS